MTDDADPANYRKPGMFRYKSDVGCLLLCLFLLWAVCVGAAVGLACLLWDNPPPSASPPASENSAPGMRRIERVPTLGASLWRTDDSPPLRPRREPSLWVWLGVTAMNHLNLSPESAVLWFMVLNRIDPAVALVVPDPDLRERMRSFLEQCDFILAN